MADLYSSAQSKVRAYAAANSTRATAETRARLPQEEHVQGGQVPRRHLRALRLLPGFLRPQRGGRQRRELPQARPPETEAQDEEETRG
jgi:hypothetical protein